MKRDPESKGNEAVQVQEKESRYQRAGCPFKCRGGMMGRDKLGTAAPGWLLILGREQIGSYLSCKAGESE